MHHEGFGPGMCPVTCAYGPGACTGQCTGPRLTPTYKPPPPPPPRPPRPDGPGGKR